MPRLTKQTPKYRHHKSRDLAFVEIDKRRIYLGPNNSPESRDPTVVAYWARPTTWSTAERTCLGQAFGNETRGG